MLPKILITDDTMFMRFNLKKILAAAGYEFIIEAGNGQEALEKYAEFQPALVLMDITMPVMDGLEALRALKASDPQAKVIMCSAMGQKNMIIEAIQAGAKDFIVKPFQPERVIESVKKHLG